ncbi:IS5 family transposase [Frankia sp. AgB1.8]|uniref:IS5 family transposase n=1 Tax=unclassified Frankia TaxID=2632575 RepID=UPI0035A8E3B9
MDDRLALRLVPDELWELVEPLVPGFTPREQGGGTAPVADRAVFTAIVYVLTSGCSWRHLPPNFGVSPPTAHRRFQQWTRAGLWPRLHRAVLDRHGAAGDIDWSSAIVDAASLRAKKGSLTGPSPVDRGKKGSKIHVLSGAEGLPLVVAVSGANLHDSQALVALVTGIPAIRSRRGPRRRRPVKLPADKGYDFDHLRLFLRERGIVGRIARRGIESTERLGRHRWKIERTIAWLGGYRRLTIRYETNGHNFLGFLSLAAALTCWKKLAT